MTDASSEIISAPVNAANCNPEIRIATTTEFYLQNTKKPNNFIIGELEQGNQLSFIVENLPKDGQGCPGKWMFDKMMEHLGPSVATIQGNWFNPRTSDNLAQLNGLTAGSSLTIEEAAAQTWTGKRASEWGYLKVGILEAIGTAGSYSKVRVLFKK